MSPRLTFLDGFSSSVRWSSAAPSSSPSRRASRAGGSPLRRGGLPCRYRNRRPSPPTAKRGGDPPAREARREGDEPWRSRGLHPPAALREREGRRFAGEGSPAGTATADPPRRPRSAAATLPLARRGGRVMNLGGPEDFTLPPRFASGRVGASPGRVPLPVPQPQTLPADREARRRPSRSRSAAGG